jgi:hypothetical protein
LSWGGGLTEGVSVLRVAIVPNLCPRRLDGKVFGAGAMRDMKVMDIGPARVAEKVSPGYSEILVLFLMNIILIVR